MCGCCIVTWSVWIMMAMSVMPVFSHCWRHSEIVSDFHTYDSYLRYTYNTDEDGIGSIMEKGETVGRVNPFHMVLSFSDSE